MKKVKAMLRWLIIAPARLVRWLERHGVDCSAEANRDDAFILAVLAASMIAMGLAAISPWLSGFAAATIIFNAKSWLNQRYPKPSNG